MLRPFDEARPGGRPFLRDRGVTAVGVCLLHAYANPAHERRMRESSPSSTREARVSISSDVLREYREYERAMTTLVDAFVKPTVAATWPHRRPPGRAAPGDGVPFYVMKSNGGVPPPPRSSASRSRPCCPGRPPGPWARPW